MIALGLVLVGTVFLLPRFVTEPWVVGGAENLPRIPEASSSTVAPSTAAELTRYRQESQAVLAEIVAIRDRLLERSVESWAEAEFGQATDMIEAGDERYAYGDYEASLEQFRLARIRLGEIETMGQQKLAQAIADAEAAIESLNPNAASTSIELAVTIAPQDSQTQELATRVEDLARVAAHIEAGDEALARDDPQAAQAEFRQAVDLDPKHRRAAKSLALAKTEVSASAFRSQMSRGFAALEGKDYDGARSAFLKAGEIQPGNVSVETALAQVENLESGSVVRNELEQAADLEAREQWREAVSIYERLLDEDPSLVDARARLIPAKVRADLDEQLSAYIEEPLRLSGEAEYRAAQGVLENAKGIANPGQRLSEQVARLDSLLQVANSAVDVVFRSDNQTHVVLFRVADLGRFQQLSLKLRPGKYVAAGTRSGYRDVRVEFTVTGEPLQEPIAVSCEEPVG